MELRCWRPGLVPHFITERNIRVIKPEGSDTLFAAESAVLVIAVHAQAVDYFQALACLLVRFICALLQSAPWMMMVACGLKKTQSM
ncbi:hypothetical protein OKW21_004613 [Catalinimonas alkaloidigena]|uniref:hypothetical protein n=1 Tax=Catalinimonas alkaloidigena TaxID=1075417 RepID=UPI00240737C6|nr:hypothetical protein [Catalinimonas alkaloidigena]MDF9799350.1 hypothetical protein [Catalinimonas alkaloidigena]